MPDQTVLIEEIQILAEQADSTSVVEEVEVVEVLAVSEQGPPGASWPEPFALSARFSEISTNDSAKAQARANLDLQDIDLGTFN